MIDGARGTSVPLFHVRREAPVAPAPDPYVLADSEPSPIHYFVATTNFKSGDEAKGRPIFPLRFSVDGGHTFHPLEIDDASRTVQASVFRSREDHPWASESLDWWAPEIWKVEMPMTAAVGGAITTRTEARYLALYTARKRDGELAIGAALANKPWENYRDLGRPLIEDGDGDGRGVIDATYVPFLNAVSWKKDGNAPVVVDGHPTQVPTPIFLQRIAIRDGSIERTGPVREIMTNDRAWEGDLVEGPACWRHGSRTFCFYSGNCYADERYAMGYAYTDEDPFTGRWIKADGPFIATDTDFIAEAGLAGPGHCMVYPVPGSTSSPRARDADLEMVFHAWPRSALADARTTEGRLPYAVRITFQDGHPRVVPGSLRPL